jgi:hypothetical protein
MFNLTVYCRRTLNTIPPRSSQACRASLQTAGPLTFPLGGVGALSIGGDSGRLELFRGRP